MCAYDVPPLSMENAFPTRAVLFLNHESSNLFIGKPETYCRIFDLVWAVYYFHPLRPGDLGARFKVLDLECLEFPHASWVIDERPELKSSNILPRVLSLIRSFNYYHNRIRLYLQSPAAAALATNGMTETTSKRMMTA
jgi:hypothetical protein